MSCKTTQASADLKHAALQRQTCVDTHSVMLADRAAPISMADASLVCANMIEIAFPVASFDANRGFLRVSCWG
jgi:hypothetical protein